MTTNAVPPRAFDPVPKTRVLASARIVVMSSQKGLPTRMSGHDETRRYVPRRRAEGMGTAEIMRCLKRYVARQTFKHLPATT